MNMKRQAGEEIRNLKEQYATVSENFGALAADRRRMTEIHNGAVGNLNIQIIQLREENEAKAAKEAQATAKMQHMHDQLKKAVHAHTTIKKKASE